MIAFVLNEQFIAMLLKYICYTNQVPQTLFRHTYGIRAMCNYVLIFRRIMNIGSMRKLESSNLLTERDARPRSRIFDSMLWFGAAVHVRLDSLMHRNNIPAFSDGVDRGSQR